MTIDTSFQGKPQKTSATFPPTLCLDLGGFACATRAETPTAAAGL